MCYKNAALKIQGVPKTCDEQVVATNCNLDFDTSFVKKSVEIKLVEL